MLRAGFARIEITPGPECSLLGYEYRQEQYPPGNAGVHDPLYARVLVLHDGTQPAVLASLDLAILETPLARHYRKVLAEKAHTTPERVIVSCTHTHSAPLPRLPEAVATEKPSQDPVSAALRTDQQTSEAYAQFIRGRLESAVAQAAGLTYPVEVSAQAAPLGLGYCRRVPTPERMRHCWNPGEWPELSPGPAPDPACAVVLLRQSNGPRSYLLWGAGYHAVVLGKTSRVVSADYPGLACRLLEEYLPGCHPIFLQGASGDAHPWIATQEDPALIQPVARAAAGLAALLAHATRPGKDHGLRIATRTVTFGKNELDLAVWRLGPAWLVAAPVELFGALGADIRRRLDGPVLLSMVSNGWSCYWPTRAAFVEGGYEVQGARGRGVEPGDGERLVDALVELAGTLNGSSTPAT